MTESAMDKEDLWLFGYGSLIWKPPPHFDKRVPGYIEGYVRRFWQASQDHRGTPEAPGRVVTLIPRDHWESLTDQHPSAPPKVWGAAYHIPPQHVDEVKTYLDIREINGYTIDYVALHVPVHSTLNVPRADMQTSNIGIDAPINCLVYIGLPSNPQFMGPQDPQKLAEHIVRSRGPSGENKEYLYMLEEALEELRKDVGVVEDVDEHVTDLTRRVREIESNLNKASVDGLVVDSQTELGAEEVEK